MNENKTIYFIDYVPKYQEIWNNILSQSDECNYDYLLTWIELCELVNKARNDNVEVYRKILFYNNEAIGVWTYTILEKDGVKTLCTNEKECLAPVFLDKVSQKVKTNSIKFCIEHLKEICEVSGITSFKTSTVMRNPDVSIWNTLLLGGNVFSSKIVNVTHLYYADLSKGNFLKNFRATARNMINKGLKEWNYKVYDEISWEELDRYRLFHEKVKNGATRGVDTWEKQMESINNKEAILVTLNDNEGQLAGGGIFYLSPLESYYNSAAYDKRDDRKNLGHTVQYLACDYISKKGVPWHRLGDCVYQNDIPAPTPKEKTISEFKSGFASHTFLNIVMECHLIK